MGEVAADVVVEQQALAQLAFENLAAKKVGAPQVTAGESLDVGQQPGDQAGRRVRADRREVGLQAPINEHVAIAAAAEGIVREEEDVDGQLGSDAQRHVACADAQPRDTYMLLRADRPVVLAGPAASGQSHARPQLILDVVDELGRCTGRPVLANGEASGIGSPPVVAHDVLPGGELASGADAGTAGG